jgi:thiamine-monophosphate kinase
LPPPPPGQHWIGDDAAVLEDGLLLKSDLLVEAVHFDLEWCSPEDAGWKAMVANLSDIAAMGGSPTAAVVSLVVRADIPRIPDQVMEGIAAASEEFACPIVGGDTSIGPALVIAVSVLGRSHARGPVLRNGARPGDFLWVTGQLGVAGTALARVTAGEADPPGLQRLRRPLPRLIEAGAAAAVGATAMIDISDGLATDLAHLCAESECSAVIDEDAIPRPAGVDLDTALLSGDDYELLFTAPPESSDEFSRIGPAAVTQIGEIVAGVPQITLRGSNGERSLVRRGWEHPVPGEGSEDG